MDSSKLSSGKTFAAGLVAGFFVICTIGFFILLGIYLSGDNNSSGDKTGETGEDYPEQFSACLDDGKYASVVRSDTQLGSSLGVNGTPATIINGYLVSGAMPFAAVQDVIQDLLSGEEPFIDDFSSYGMQSGELTLVGEPTLSKPVWRGNENAKVTLVEFSDFECPYCGRFFPVVEQVLAHFGDQIRFTYRHFPLNNIHPQAQKAAEAFECAKEQGMAFEMHDELFGLAEAGRLGTENYKQLAEDLGLE